MRSRFSISLRLLNVQAPGQLRTGAGTALPSPPLWGVPPAGPITLGFQGFSLRIWWGGQCSVSRSCPTGQSSTTKHLCLLCQCPRTATPRRSQGPARAAWTAPAFSPHHPHLCTRSLSWPACKQCKDKCSASARSPTSAGAGSSLNGDPRRPQATSLPMSRKEVALW